MACKTILLNRLASLDFFGLKEWHEKGQVIECWQPVTDLVSDPCSNMYGNRVETDGIECCHICFHNKYRNPGDEYGNKYY